MYERLPQNLPFFIFTRSLHDLSCGAFTMLVFFGAGSKINRQQRSQLAQALRTENGASSSSHPDSGGH